MFDIGFTELALLAVLGLLVLGPERLPRVARSIGLYVRKARGAWFSLRQSIERELDTQAMKDALNDVRDEARQASQILKQSVISADADAPGQQRSTGQSSTQQMAGDESE